MGQFPNMTNANEPLYDSQKGANNGVASLDATGKIPSDQIPFGFMEFLGNWDASTNTPTLANTDTGAQGNTYRCNVAGTVDFGAGNITFAIGDFCFNNGTIWDKGDNTDAVTSVFGRLGIVIAQTGDYTASQVTNAFDKSADTTDDITEGATKKFNKTHTGDVTGSGALTIGANKVSNSKLSQVATNIIKGRTSPGTGNIEDLTASQVTSILNAFTSALKGLVPASGGGTTNFLRADGNWSAPIPSVWQPPVMPLGGVLVSGAQFFINGGAGVYLAFDGASDDRLFFNYTLHGANGVDYDGSDLAVKLHGRISTNGSGGDTVGWKVDYAIVKDGDNSSTMVTNIAQQNVNVSSKNRDIEFDITLGTMTGVADGHNLMFTLTRNATGIGSDTYSGNFELIGIEIIKV